jgi:dTDP-4-amino-4,6-dideoxygalactose transaminase
MGVPFLDLRRQYESIRPEVERRLTAILETQGFVLGPNGRELEEAIRDHLKVEHAVGVASGTDAILLSLRALDLTPGDGVLTTSFTFFATAGAIHNAGGRPFFADIRPDTFNLDPVCVRRFLEEDCVPGEGKTRLHRTLRSPIRFLLPVHLYGQAADMDELNELAEEFGLKVIEDACQAVGARYKDRFSGGLGDAGAFSFFPTKNLGGGGDGGMITTNDGDLAERLRSLRVHGGKTRYIHDEIGYNSRMDEIQAAILMAKIPHLADWNVRRAAVASRYDQALGDLPGVTPPKCLSDRTHIYHQYVIRTPHRDDLKSFLGDRGIGAMVYYPVPLHMQPCFQFLGYREGELPETERAAVEVLALPVFPELTEVEITEVSEAIRNFHEEPGNDAG